MADEALIRLLQQGAASDDAQKKKQSAEYWAAVDRLIKTAKNFPDPAQYPRYGFDDFPLYAEAAYGTPFDAYINGDAARGAVTPKLTQIVGGQHHTTAIPSTVETKDQYARLMAYALRNPITALGASDPSRIGMVKENPTLPWVAGMMGYYAPKADVGEANVNRNSRPGILEHEFTHRGLAALKQPGFDSDPNWLASEHAVMAAQDEQYAGVGSNFPRLMPGLQPGDTGREEWRDLVAKAQQEIASRRPYGGPR